MKNILLIFGTRPEAIKMCPLVLELKKRSDLNTIVCVTGQHRQMLDSVLDVFGVKPDYDLAIMKAGQTLFDITTGALNGMRGVIEQVRPDLCLVHGDTSTAFSAALAAYYMNVPVGHVEAGLRTHNIRSPYPEEFNRQAISIVSEYNFAPTITAKQNLLNEGRKSSTIFVTGNTAIDALDFTVRSDYSSPLLDAVGDSRLILITAHRRENLGEPMRNMFRAIKRVIDEYPDLKAVYPVHLNPAVRQAADEIFGQDEKIILTDPLDVIDFHNIMSRSFLILTDSGGVQEEAPALGKPVLVMRDTTERPEGVAAGTLKLTGTEEDSIYNSFKELIEDRNAYIKMSAAVNPYGDGCASRRIADIIEFGSSDEFSP